MNFSSAYDPKYNITYIGSRYSEYTSSLCESKAPSTLIRFRLKTHAFRISVDDRRIRQKWRFSKTLTSWTRSVSHGERKRIVRSLRCSKFECRKGVRVETQPVAKNATPRPLQAAWELNPQPIWISTVGLFHNTLRPHTHGNVFLRFCID